MIYIHCHGHECSNNGSSPNKPTQADAVEHVLRTVTRQYTGIPPSILVLTPYRGQQTLLTQQLAKYNNWKVKVSTIDAAQGQEADLLITSFVIANETGIAGFTDDAKRLNVAIARAKAAVVIVGHLATSLAAPTSGFSPLLYELRQQRNIYDYHPEEAQPMQVMTEAIFKKTEVAFPADTTSEQRRRKEEGKARAAQQSSAYDTPRASEQEIKHTVDKTRSRHLIELTIVPNPSCWPCLVSPRVSSHSTGIERQTKEHIDIVFERKYNNNNIGQHSNKQIRIFNVQWTM